MTETDSGITRVIGDITRGYREEEKGYERGGERVGERRRKIMREEKDYERYN